MAGNLHAFALIAVIAGTAFVLTRYGSWPLAVINVMWGLFYGAVLWALARIFSSHFCYAGDAVTQSLIPAVCLALIASFAVQPKILRIGSLISLSVVGIGLSLLFTDLVHRDGYTGNRNLGVRYVTQLRRDYPKDIKKYLDNYPSAAQSFPSGWLKDSAAVKNIPADERQSFEHDLTIRAYHVYPFWHSRLTGLYRTTTYSLDAWYPGGPLKEGLRRIEFRER